MPYQASIKYLGYLERIYPDNGVSIGQFASLDFEGLLEITDPEQFVKAMYTGQANRDPNIHGVVRGLGRSKAFGCGLMLIRKV